MKRIVIITIIWICLSTVVSVAQKLDYEQYTLKNGLQVTLIDYGSIEATSVNLFVNVGQKNETPGYQGISGFTAEALTLGNAKYDNVQMLNALYPMAASISARANESFTTISCTFLNKDLDKGMELFAATVRQPTFPELEVKQVIGQFVQYNNPNKMDISTLADRFSSFFVFGISNPMGRSAYATQVSKLTAKNLKEFYDFNYTPKNSKLVIAGKLDKEKIKKLVDTFYSNWETVYGENNAVLLEPPAFKGKEYAFVNRDNATQVYLQWTKKAPYINDKDLIAFKVSIDIFNKKLFEEIREKLGKTYGIYMQFSETQNKGTYSVSTQTRSKEMTSTMEAFEKTLTAYYNNGMTEEELRLTKLKMKNNYLAVLDPVTVVSHYNPIMYPDLKKRMMYLEILNSLSLEMVNKTIKKYYNPANTKLVIAGNEKDLATQLEQIKGLVKFANNAIDVDQ